MKTIFTIGHSRLSLDDFIARLKKNGVARVADVRTIPRSRFNPQFNRETLPGSLVAAGIGYTHMPGLGGLRRPQPDSLNTGWRNASFRGFADYMQTDQFQAALGDLIDMAQREVVVLMCAEAVPWRCHRSLIGDALVVRGIAVKDIIGPQKTRDHVLTPWAKVSGDKVTYPSLI